DGYQRIATTRAFRRLRVRIEGIYRVDPVRHYASRFHQCCGIESGRAEGWLVSSSSRIAERSSAISTSKSRLKTRYGPRVGRWCAEMVTESDDDADVSNCTPLNVPPSLAKTCSNGTGSNLSGRQPV